MSAGWYYMASGWFQKNKRVGPISDAELLMRIDTGKILPETLLQSDKTRGKWVPMSNIHSAMKRYKRSHPEADTAS
ncbi:MAG: DUF4339 domain-containing protein [Planctomycetota bacterium]